VAGEKREQVGDLPTPFHLAEKSLKGSWKSQKEKKSISFKFNIQISSIYSNLIQFN